MLFDLAAAGDRGAFFDQPIEKVAGLANAALQIAMERPREYSWLILVFAHRAATPDLVALLDGSPAGSVDAIRDAALVRARVGTAIQRSLDGLVVALASDWERYLRLAAAIFGAEIFAALSAPATRSTSRS